MLIWIVVVAGVAMLVGALLLGVRHITRDGDGPI
jgi:phosphate/sulfate permease